MEEENWQLIELSKINDKIIQSLLYKLKTKLSEDVFISLESLFKIGQRAISLVKKFLIQHSESKVYHIALIRLLLQYLQEKPVNPRLFKLYHPDFVIRAKAIMEISKKDILDNLALMLPILNDPDDSVRYAMIKTLLNYELMSHNKIIPHLKKHYKRESNSVIKRKIRRFLENC